MFKLAWLILVLMLVAGACAAPGLDPRSTADRPVAQNETIPPADTDQPEEGDSPTRAAAATPTPDLGNAPTETQQVPGVDPVPAIATNVPKASTPVTEAGAAEVTPEEAGRGSSPTQEQLRLLADLNNFGPAPELSNETWLNSEPLTLAELRGKVVMVEFWTFG
jgi:hypothetical protein